VEEVISFLTVLVVAVVIAGGIGTMYATGLRLWARSAAAEQEGHGFMGSRIASVACFVACILVVLFALWLMIPLFH